ncbi:MAG: hypothetical protein ABI543_08860, partial [Ignavibacteria bacterium]
MKKYYKVLIIITVFLNAVWFSSCGEDAVTPIVTTSNTSDLTRTGKFISFTSNLTGNYDIYLAQVNSSG